MRLQDHQQTDCPPFEGIVTRCRKHAQWVVSARLRQLLDHTDEALEQFSEKAGSDFIQNRLTEARSMMKSKRAHLEILFIREFQRPFFGLLPGDGKAEPAGDEQTLPLDSAELSLVEHDQMEEAVAMENLISKVQDNCFSELYALRQRLTVINGSRPLDNKQLPAGPHHLVHSFHAAISNLDTDVKIKLILYALFDKYVTREIKRLYVELNDILKEAGILPNLKAVIRRQTAGDANTQPVGNETSGDIPPPLSPGGSIQPNGSPRPQTLGDELFDTIIDLMTTKGSRNLQNSAASRARASAAGGIGNSVVAQLSSLIKAIGKIQVGSVLSYGSTSSGEGTASPVASDPRFVEKTKQVLSGERTQIFEQLGQQQLAPVDADLIDIVGMMFEYMLNDPLLPNVAKALISRLHTPYLKVALIDPRLRTDKAHPARQFLDLLVEAGCLYVDETDTSRGIFPEMRALVERVLGEFSENTELFGELLSILESTVKEQRRKATSIEQRAQQAIRGQEKLLLAKQTAASAMAVRASRPFLPKEAVSFLTAVWIDRLVFILLRDAEGEKSEDWRQALRIADTLVSAFNPAELATDQEVLKGLLPKLCREIETELGSLGGRFPETWRALAAILSDPESVLRGAQEYQRLAAPTAAHAKTPQTAVTPPSAALAPVAVQVPPTDSASKPAISREEQRLIEEFRNLPFGTWVEFAASGDSPPRRLKLSWFSPLTGTCMFVDNFGRKAETKPIRTVTAEIMAKRAKIIRQATQPFFERALQSIQEMLRMAQNPLPGGGRRLPSVDPGRSSSSAGSQE